MQQDTSMEYCDFKTLRQAYLTVKKFLRNETHQAIESLETKIEHDLGLAGDDSYELIEKFVAEYGLDDKQFDYSKHFLSEDELSPSAAIGGGLIMLPFMVIIWLVWLTTLGRIDHRKDEIFPDCHRQTSDLSFGDMVVWYLKGTFSPRENVSIRLCQK